MINIGCREKRIVYLTMILLMPLLGGCWDRYELTRWGFVQAVAIDHAEKGEIRMTTQIYRPGASESSSGIATKGNSYLTLASAGKTISEAAARISGELGRKLQWSHMRVILIGDEISHQRDIGEMMDYFSRSQGPRGSAHIMTTEGAAGRYLNIKPLIESTIGQQLRTVEIMFSMQSGQVDPFSLLEMNVVAESKGLVALLPHLRLISHEQEAVVIDGMSLLRFPSGKIDANLIPVRMSDSIMMIRGAYKGGLVTLACPVDSASENGATADSYQVSSVQSKVQITNAGGKPHIDIRMKLEGKILELNCSSILTKDQQAQFVKRLEQRVQDNALEAVRYMQKMKADVILADQQLQRHHPKLWKMWSADWNELFATAEVTVSVSAGVTDTGIDVGKPLTPTEP